MHLRVIFGHPRQIGDLRSAGPTPRGPEVEHDEVPTVVVQAHRRTIGSGQRKMGGIRRWSGGKEGYPHHKKDRGGDEEGGGLVFEKTEQGSPGVGPAGRG